MGAKWTYALIAINYFLVGLEKGVILPFLWNFLKEKFEEDSGIFYGATISIYSVSAMGMSFVFGYWIEKLQNGKLILALGDVFAVCAMFLYFTSINKWFLPLSRLLAGVAWAVRPATLSDISKATNSKERTAIFSYIEVCEPVGLIVGPMCVFFLMQFDFHITTHVHINEYTSSGLFMFVLYSAHLVATILFYGDLPPTSSESQSLVRTIAMDGSLVGQTSYGIGMETENKTKYNQFPDCEEEQEEEEEEEEKLAEGQSNFISILPSDGNTVNADVVRRNKTKGIENKSKTNGLGLTSETNQQSLDSSPSGGKKSVSPPLPTEDGDDKWESLRFLLNDHYLCLLFGDFTAWFSMMAVLTIAFPFGESYFNWSLGKVGVIATVMSIFTALSYVILSIATKYIKDERKFLIIFQVTSLLTNIALMISIALSIPNDALSEALVLFFTGVFALLVPLNSPLIASHLTKICQPRKQGLALGLRGIVESFASILSPLWAGTMLGISVFGLFGVNLVFTLITLGMVVGSWARLKAA